MIGTDIVQITADNNNVFNARVLGKPPAWARTGRIQIIASDTDWLFDLKYGAAVLADQSAPHRSQADNIQQPDWASPHCQFDVGPNEEPRLNINVVTAGVGLAVLQWES